MYILYTMCINTINTIKYKNIQAWVYLRDYHNYSIIAIVCYP